MERKSYTKINFDLLLGGNEWKLTLGYKRKEHVKNEKQKD